MKDECIRQKVRDVVSEYLQNNLKIRFAREDIVDLACDIADVVLGDALGLSDDEQDDFTEVEVNATKTYKP